jgi:beta-phosphoglucomutase
MIEAVLFDFNGVVIDDEPLQLSAYRDALGAHQITLTDEDYYGALGMDDVTFVRSSFERAGRELDDETVRSVIARKSELHRASIEGELPLFTGVVNFVKALARNYPLGVVSMALRSEIDYALERAGVRDLFEVVVSAEDVRGACKPDPACYRLALDRLNRNREGSSVLPLHADECLVVEDSPPGIRAARAAGMRTLAVTNTVPERPLREAGAEIVTGSLFDWTVDAVRHLYDKR